MNNILCQEIHNAYIGGDDKMLQKLWDKDVPSTLIKFFPATYEQNGTNYFLEHIENEEIWLSSPLRFNDPFDCVYNYNYSNEIENIKNSIIKKFSDNKDFINFINSNACSKALHNVADDVKSFFEHVYYKYESSKFISCFSESENLYSKRMWAYYANSHKGVCAEYDFKTVNNICEFGCIPVKYTDIYSRKLQPLDAKERTEEFLKLFYSKSIEWQYEKEWRIAMEAKNGKLGCNAKCRLPIKIFLGCKTEKKLRRDVLEICREKQIEVFQMKTMPGSFNLTFELCR